MNPDIDVIREGNAYRLLHGHLHLASELSLHGEVAVDVRGEGQVKVIRTRQGHFAGKDGQWLPMLCDCSSSFQQADDDQVNLI